MGAGAGRAIGAGARRVVPPARGGARRTAATAASTFRACASAPRSAQARSRATLLRREYRSSIMANSTARPRDRPFRPFNAKRPSNCSIRLRRGACSTSICAACHALARGCRQCLATQWRSSHHEIVGYFNVRSSRIIAMQVLVVGAGVVGLGIARAVALAGHEVIVAEAESAIGTVTSSRNSEVIHAGLYYRPTRCARSTARAAAACSTTIAPTRGVPHRKTGKIVVATQRQRAQAARRDLQAGADQRLRERRADRRRGGEEARAGGVLRRRDELARDRHHRQPPLHARVARRDRGSRRHDRAQHAHRAAGADAGRLGSAFRRRRDDRRRCRGQFRRARRAEARAAPPRAIRRSGCRSSRSRRATTSAIRAGRCSSGWSIRRRSPAGSASTSCSISPAACASVPTSNGSSDENYDVDPGRAAAFYASIRKYWPGLPDNSLIPDYAGIRPKISGQGEPALDFIIDAPEGPRRAAAGDAVRHRVAGADGVAVDRRGSGELICRAERGGRGRPGSRRRRGAAPPAGPAWRCSARSGSAPAAVATPPTIRDRTRSA